MTPAAPSFWLEALPDDPLSPRAALDGDAAVDVCIVGAGFTGLWTAWYLREADPTLRVLVVEAEVAGFGASGRNGGWCSALLPMSWDAIARRAGRDAAVRLQRAMFATVDEVLARAAGWGLDVHAAKAGWLQHATHPAHLERLRARIAEARSWGFTDADVRWLDRDEAVARVGAAGTLASVFTPHCAVLHPGRLVRGLARAVERAGVRVCEGTRVTGLEPGRVRSTHGVVRADVVVRATEAFTARLPGRRRTVAPLYSLMVATEPLPDGVWDEIGWAGREAFNDARNMIVYGQRTVDGRIAFGGRGAPYHFASRIEPRFDQHARVHQHLLPQTLHALFPALAGVQITHRWGGPLAAPRDWWCSVGYDRASGLAWAGGYVGDGVATANLAGRTLADLVTGRASDLTTLAWVGHTSPRWEPEPLRWLGINAGLHLTDGADRAEQRGGRPSRWRQWAMRRLLGH